MQDRAFSDKFLTISDIRMVNLGANTDEIFPIWLPGIRNIADRIMSKERQFQALVEKMRKRYMQCL